jgi:hypothetical protein
MSIIPSALNWLVKIFCNEHSDDTASVGEIAGIFTTDRDRVDKNIVPFSECLQKRYMSRLRAKWSQNRDSILDKSHDIKGEHSGLPSYHPMGTEALSV